MFPTTRPTGATTASSATERSRMPYTAEIFVDSTMESLGAFEFGAEPEVDRHVVLDGKDYIIVGTMELVHSDSEYDYEVRVMPDHYDFE